MEPAALGRDKVTLLGLIASRGKTGEMKIGPPASKKPVPAKDSIEGRIKELRTHPAYFDKNHKSHKEVVQQVSDLYSQLHQGR